MKKITFTKLKGLVLWSFILFATYAVHAQCINTVPFGTASANSDTNVFPSGPGTNTSGQPQIITTCAYTSEYNTINDLIIGQPYIFEAYIGDVQKYITITDANNTVISHGNSPLLVTSITAATVRLHLTDDILCGSTNSCHTTRVQFLPACPSPNQLAISNLTTTSADLSWNPLGSEAAWDLQWGPTGFALGDGTSVNNLASASYQLINLNASTTYQFYVRAKCTTEDSNWNGPFTFTTLCVSVQEFIQNFDSSPTGWSNDTAMPTCWARGGTGTVYNATGSVLPMSAPNRMYMFASGTGTPTEAFVMTPTLSNLQAGTHRLKFKAFSFDEDRIMEVGYLTDATDVSTFMFIQEIALPSGPENAVEFTVTPGILPATAVRLAFKNPGFPGASTGLYLDDIKWEVASSCADPTNLLANNITDSGFTAAWTAGAAQSEWEVQYGLSNFALGSGTMIEDIITPSVAISGLSSNTTYQYYVRAVCATEPSSWVGPITLTTNCSASAVPVVQAFNTFLPGCWEKKIGVLEANSIVTGTNAGNWSGGNFGNAGSNPAVRINLWATQNSWLISEPIDLGATPSLHRLRYNVALTNFFGSVPQTNMGTHTVHVVVSSDGGNTWSNTNVIKTYEGSGFVPGEEFINLTGYSGIIKIGFVATTNSFSPDIDFHLDNFRVEVIPTCEEPTNVSVTDVTKFGATINYTHALTGVTTADVQYGAVGFPIGTGTIVNATANPIVLTGLTSSTDYQFYIRNVCAVGNESPWVGPFQFTTICDYPDLSGTTPGSVCGEGNVTLSAQSLSPTAGFEWYAAATGGVPLATGASFSTPLISQTTSYFVSSNSVIPNTNVAVGNGALNATFQNGTTFNHGWGGYKTQNLIKAEELIAAGISAGPINSVAWELVSTGVANRNNFSLAIKATTAQVMTNTHQDAMVEVFATPILNLTIGQNVVLFSTPFIWDGTSNIVIQTCWSNENFGDAGAGVVYDITNYVSSTYTFADNQPASVLCATMTGAAGGSGSTATASLRPKFTFNATGVCRSPRQEVVAMVTDATPIEIEATTVNVCAGSSTALSVTSTNANYTYVWTPGDLTGASITVSPEDNTVYSVTAVDATTSCQISSSIDINVTLVPTQTVAVDEISVCQNETNPIQLDAEASTGEVFMYSLNMLDSFGDGWNGNTMSLSVNGVVVLEDVTMATGSQLSFPFEVVGGDAITTIWNGGGFWTEECSYTITNNEGVVLFSGESSSDGPTPVTTPIVVPSSVTISWWTEATGGTQIATGNSISLVGSDFLPNTAVAGTYMVYVQSENAGCPSLVRTPITVIVLEAPLAPTAESQSFCNEGNVGDLVASVDDVDWFASADAEVPLSSDTELVSGLYFVSQTNDNGCESARTAVEVLVSVVAPPQLGTQSYCNGSTVADMVAAINLNVLCYGTIDAVTPMQPTDMLENGTFFVSQVENGCESARIAVQITIIEVEAPTADAIQALVEGSTVANLVAVGQNIVWYASEADALAGTNPLSSSEILVDGTVYYAVQTIDGCKSQPFGVLVDIILSTDGFDISQLKYYPNPVNQTLNISYSEVISNVKVINILGQTVLSSMQNSNFVSIEMTQLPAGSYMVQIESNDATTVIKVMKR